MFSFKGGIIGAITLNLLLFLSDFVISVFCEITRSGGFLGCWLGPIFYSLPQMLVYRSIGISTSAGPTYLGGLIFDTVLGFLIGGIIGSFFRIKEY